LDNDANFIIDPDPEFSNLANRVGLGFRTEVSLADESGPNPKDPDWGFAKEGLIEAEIESVPDLIKPVFAEKSGMRLAVTGWWVQDYMHNNKTEIHPLRTLVGQMEPGTPGTGARFHVLVAQDNSKRFCVSDSSMQEKVVVPVNPRPDIAIVGSTASPGGSAELLLENSVLDGDIGSQRSSFGTLHTLDSLEMTLGMLPANAGSPTNYFPIYLGTFERKDAVFKDTVNHVIVPPAVPAGPGCKALRVSIRAEFELPSSAPPLARWSWTAPDAPVQTTPAFSRTFEYSPCSGQSSNELSLVGVAESNYSSISDLPSRPPRGGNGDPGRTNFLSTSPSPVRSYAQKARTYVTPRASIALTDLQKCIKQPGPSVTIGGQQCSAGGAIACRGKVVSAGITQAPGLAPAELQWRVDGVAFPTSNRLETPTYTATLDPSHPYQIDISCKTGPAVAAVKASYSNDLGESPSAQISVANEDGVSSVGGGLKNCLDDVFKLEILLRNCGLQDLSRCKLTVPVGPGPIGPIVLAKGNLLQAFDQNVQERFGDKGSPKYSTANEELLRIISAIRSGKPLNPTQSKILLDARGYASRVTFDSSVPESDLSVFIEGMTGLRIRDRRR